MSAPHRVVIVGGGFGGLYAAKTLGGAPVAVTLVDRRNFHLFQPLLYQVATGELSPANIASPLRAVLSRQRNTRVLLAEVTGLDAARRAVLLADGELPYDTLVLAPGARPRYFGHDEWARHAPSLKTIEDATEIRRRLLGAFELAEKRPDARSALLTFAVIGGGPTGVELAGAVADIARHTLRHDFRSIDPGDARVVLVEAGPRILASFPEGLAASAARALGKRGVAIVTGAKVTSIDSARVVWEKDGREETLETSVALWAAGVAPSDLAEVVAKATGAELDRAGRIVVAPDLTIPGHPEVLVIGDLARVDDARGEPLPGLAPVAMQEGRYAARLVAARLRGRTLPPFRYRDKGTLATIGRAAAVADLGRIRLTGLPAWLAWIFIHLMYLVEFENRLLVLLQWAWNYATWNRSARLITGGRGGQGTE
ncbi:MAG TPA: NAD(P)/FAD-dependent oxidoreductase [Thermoanaerobaculia bacterium]|nr:NAD(P)/FAD-dependent oxidoreductase [Thermoanaerobaculia bacterium]